MEEMIDFLKKLTEMTNKTGIIIDTFGDSFYDPSLANEDNFSGQDVEERVYFSYDPIQKTYVGRLRNPYDGEVVFPKGYVEN